MYSVETDLDAVAEVEALPPEALALFAELMLLLEIAPWSGDPYSRVNADSGMRTITFGRSGEGLVVYFILEDQRRVIVLRVVWMT